VPRPVRLAGAPIVPAALDAPSTAIRESWDARQRDAAQNRVRSRQREGSSMRHGHGLPVARPACAVLASLALLAAAHAQPGMAPGLWETKTSMKNAQMDDAMAKMQGQMANMSPEQRQMVEQMMASRGVGVGGQAHTVRVCISKEQAARGGVPQTDGRCSQQEVSRSGSSVKYSFSCAGEHPTTGTGEFTMTSPKSWTMHSVSDTTVQGKPQHVEMDIAGTWVADDCGSVKPFAAAAH
jgi:hypothetical protein